MKLLPMIFAVVLALSALGCQSIVAPGQDRAALEESGALKWAVSEYDAFGAHWIWIPHWQEGLLGLSSPKARNCRDLDLLRIQDGRLTSVQHIGTDRGAWAEMLQLHGRFQGDPDQQAISPLYMAVSSQIVHAGASLECVYFAKGFPLYGPEANPRCHRPPGEIKRDDVLYYLTTRGGTANEIIMRDGRVEEIRDAKHLGKDFDGFYHRITLY